MYVCMYAYSTYIHAYMHMLLSGAFNHCLQFQTHACMCIGVPMCMCASMFVCTCVFAPNNQVNLIYLQLILHFCACMQLLCIEIYVGIYYVYDMYIIVLHTYVCGAYCFLLHL